MRRSGERGVQDDVEGVALLRRVGVEVRRLGRQSVLTNEVVAHRFGLHVTDLDGLDAIMQVGTLTMGDLASTVGLSSGATTALVDRLEKAGYVERVPDPTDRRRVTIRGRPYALQEIEAIYRPMKEMMVELWSGFTPQELGIVADFLRRSTDLAAGCREEIARAGLPPAPVSGSSVSGSGPVPTARRDRRDR